MSRRRGVALLDVNVLVALFDPDHVHHDLAHDWFRDDRRHGWATCATTENGFVRVLANPAYGAVASRPGELLGSLRRFCSAKEHHFWAEDLSLRDASVFDPALIRGHRQVTDIYLLGLAVRMSGRLVTFDRTVPLAGVAGAAPDALAVVAP